MAYSSQTTNYGLPLPTGTDKSSWLDNNDAFTAVDTALAGAVAGVSTNAADIAALESELATTNANVTTNATNIATNAADIVTLQSRATAVETVAANALEGVAQLSEKVFELEERTFTSIQDVYDYLTTLSHTEMQCVRFMGCANSFTSTTPVVSFTISDTNGTACVSNGVSHSSPTEIGTSYGARYPLTSRWDASTTVLAGFDFGSGHSAYKGNGCADYGMRFFSDGSGIMYFNGWTSTYDSGSGLTNIILYNRYYNISSAEGASVTTKFLVPAAVADD